MVVKSLSRQTSLDPEVLSLVEMSPVEDLLLALLRSKITTIPIGTKYEMHQQFPFILVRSTGAWGDWSGDPRFLDASGMEVHALCDGLNADEDANKVSEAIRVILRDSRNVVVPGYGHIVSIQMIDRPHRSPDWGTSQGPVQYADLPSGVERWQTTYRLTIRKPAIKPFA